MNDNKAVEIWLRMYEGQHVHARHHEVLRTQSTNLIVLISAALLALSGSQTGHLDGSIIGAFIIVVNLYGLLMSLKHYERSRLHASVGAEYRNVISDNTAIGGQHLDNIRTMAHQSHKPMLGIQKLRAFVLWVGLHILLLLIGLFLALA